MNWSLPNSCDPRVAGGGDDDVWDTLFTFMNASPRKFNAQTGPLVGGNYRNARLVAVGTF